MSAAILTSGIPVIAHHIPPLVNLMRGIGNTIPVLDSSPAPYALQLG